MTMKFDLKKYMNPIFVETGTFHGDGIKEAINVGFDKIYSIEVKQEFYQECSKKFYYEINKGQVELILGDSQYALSDLVKNLDKPTTFWLDAHTHEGGKGHKNCPLYEELEHIKSHPIKCHTILIDDLRLIKSRNAWGGHDVTVEGLIEKIKKINPNYQIVFEDGHVEKDVLCAYISQSNVKKNMDVEPLKKLRRLGLPLPKGIIHIGANSGQEALGYASYDSGKCVYIEPISEIYNELIENLDRLKKSSNHIPIQALLLDRNNLEFDFNISSNKGLSSSIFPLGKHGKIYPNVTYTRQEKMKSKTLDYLILNQFNRDNFDLLVLDVQGAELKALLGSIISLQDQIKYVYTEISEEPLYLGGCTFEQVTNFLKSLKFRLKSFDLNSQGWGNALYVKELKNLALHKPCQQSSISRWSHLNDAQGAVNGIKTGNFSFHTNREINPWWQVDLQQEYLLSEVRVYNRLYSQSERANTLSILLSNDADNWHEVYKYENSQPFGGIDGFPLVVKLNKNQPFRYVRLQLNEVSCLHLDEVEIYSQEI